MTKSKGIGKLLKVSPSDDKNWFEVDLAVDATMEQTDKGNVNTQLGWNLRVPGDGSTGPVKKVAKMKFNIELLLPPQPGLDPGAKFKSTINVAATYDIKYGLPPDLSSPKAPVATGKPWVILHDFKVGWLDANKTALKVAVKYSFKDGLQPKPGADYLLYASFRYENAASKAYEAQRVAGTEMKLDGWFTNDSLPIGEVPPMPSACDLFLVWKR